MIVFLRSWACLPTGCAHAAVDVLTDPTRNIGTDHFIHRPGGGGGGGGGIRGGFSFRGRPPLSLSHMIRLRAQDLLVTPDVYVARALKDEPMEEVERLLDRLVWKGGIRNAWITAYRTAAVRLHEAAPLVPRNPTEKELMALEDQMDGPHVPLAERIEALRRLTLAARPGTVPVILDAIQDSTKLPWSDGVFFRAAACQALDRLAPGWDTEICEEWLGLKNEWGRP